MPEKVILTHSVEQTMKLAEAISSVLKAGDVIILNGDLGAGKTVFAQGFSKGINIKKNIVSPTFTLSKKYVGEKLNLVHADIYRMLENVSLDNQAQREFLLENIETLDFAKDEEDSIFLIEWGDAIKDYFPQGVLEITLDRNVSEYTEFVDFGALTCEKKTVNKQSEKIVGGQLECIDEQAEYCQDRIIRVNITCDRYKKVLDILDI